MFIVSKGLLFVQMNNFRSVNLTVISLFGLILSLTVKKRVSHFLGGDGANGHIFRKIPSCFIHLKLKNKKKKNNKKR